MEDQGGWGDGGELGELWGGLVGAVFGKCVRRGGGEGRTFVVMFWVVVPFVQGGVVLLVVGGWGFCGFGVDDCGGGGGEIELFERTIGGEGGGMEMDTGGVEVGGARKLDPSPGKFSIVGEAVALARVGGVSSVDPSSGKYSTVGDCEAVGPAVGLKTVPLACEGGINSEDPFPKKYSFVGDGPIVVVLTGVSVTNLDTT